jgi:transposase-like protein
MEETQSVEVGGNYFDKHERSSIARGKSMKKTVVSVFTYTSVCCGVPGKKTPCVKEVGDKRDGKSVSQSPLGKWKCSACKKTCKVKRGKRAEQIEDRTGRISPAEVGRSSTADTV